MRVASQSRSHRTDTAFQEKTFVISGECSRGAGRRNAAAVGMVTAALVDKGARAGRTEPCCGRGSSSLGSCAPHVLSLTECWLEQGGE